MSTKGGNERGSVLIIAVVGMLILGILSVSFSLLASVESKIGVNYKHQQQARMLAEAGLSLARDAVSDGATRTDGFTGWLNGPDAVHILVGTSATSGRALDPGQLWARIDNDCDSIAEEGGGAGSAQIVPLAIRESVTCNNTADTNQTAVVTAWATVGTGNSAARARVRAIVGTDDPWRHVCSTATASGTCVDPNNQSGNPTINPSDPGHPNGPRAYPTLPHPVLGCSAIDPTMHGAVPGCPPGARKVLTGDAALMNCNGGGENYAGYFDCALTTPCDAPDYCPPAPGASYRDACVRGGDGRAPGGVPSPAGPNTFYVATGTFGAPAGVCPATGPTGNPVTGMVFNNYENTAAVPNRPLRQTPNVTFDGRVGCNIAGSGVCPPANIVGRTIYVMHASTTYTASGRIALDPGSGADNIIYGTVAVEGGGSPEECPGNDSDFAAKAQTQIHTAPQPAVPFPATAGKVYGYPLVLLLYDPQQPEPTSSTRQQICADLGAGGGNTIVDGIVYSSGKVEFNPLTLQGGVVAYDVETQGSATYTYSNVYANAAPPPGFPPLGGASIAILRKSFVTCTNYSVNSSGTEYPAPSRCN